MSKSPPSARWKRSRWPQELNSGRFLRCLDALPQLVMPMGVGAVEASAALAAGHLVGLGMVENLLLGVCEEAVATLRTGTSGAELRCVGHLPGIAPYPGAVGILALLLRTQRLCSARAPESRICPAPASARMAWCGSVPGPCSQGDAASNPGLFGEDWSTGHSLARTSYLDGNDDICVNIRSHMFTLRCKLSR